MGKKNRTNPILHKHAWPKLEADLAAIGFEPWLLDTLLDPKGVLDERSGFDGERLVALCEGEGYVVDAFFLRGSGGEESG